jgi:hypothetical protein
MNILSDEGGNGGAITILGDLKDQQFETGAEIVVNADATIHPVLDLVTTRSSPSSSSRRPMLRHAF